MESHSGINKLKWLGYVAATVGFAINLAIFHGFSKAERSKIDDLYFVLGGIGVVTFIAWPITVYKNATKPMVVCILFFGVEIGVACCFLLRILAEVPHYEIFAIVYVIIVIFGAFLYLTIFLYRKINENNKKPRMPQPPVEPVEKPLVTEA